MPMSPEELKAYKLAFLKKQQEQDAAHKAEMASSQQSDALPEPQIPENYTLTDQIRDNKESSNADQQTVEKSPESDQAIVDDLEDAKSSPVPSEATPTQGAVASNKSEPEEVKDDSIEGELDKSGRTLAGEPESTIGRGPAADPVSEDGPDDIMPPDQSNNEDSKKNYYSDLMARFKEAQHKAELNKQGAQFANYAQLAGESFQHKDQSALQNRIHNNLDANANLPIEQFTQQLAIEGVDPDSQAANSMRNAYSSALGIDPSKLQGLNVAQMEKSFQFLGKNANDKILSRIKNLQVGINQQKANAQQKGVELKDQQFQFQKPLIAAKTDQANASADYLGQKPGFEQQKIDASLQNKETATTEKQKSSDEKEIAKGMKEGNGLSASSRSVIGSAERIKAGGQRLISIVDDQNATPQDLQSAYADMNAMISGNTTVSGQDHAAYNNLQTNFAKALQYLTSSPHPAEVPEVKAHLKDVAKRIMDLSDKIQDKQLHKVYLGRRAVYDRNPTARQDLIDSVKELPDSATATGGGYDGSTSLQNPTPAQNETRKQYLEKKAGQ